MILDWEKYLDKSRETVTEGCVLLKNDNNALPLTKNCRISVFGRMQNHYYKSGLGSGGMVNVSKVTGVLDALLECKDVQINQELLDVYNEWEKSNPVEKGIGWGQEPWSQKEMPLSNEVAAKAATVSDTAIVIIARTAGEEQDSRLEEGSYLLTKTEEEMMATVRRNFKRMIVLLNVGSIIDMSFVKKYNPDSVMYIWQGGMNGGYGVVDLLTGKVNPSGKLTDTIAVKTTDYPSDKNFGDPDENIYQEDIYVGYRYFETFNKAAVLYPFGFGLSYTTFDIKAELSNKNEKSLTFKAIVTNTGKVAGKEPVIIYAEAPQGKLGKPARVLCGFNKTSVLQPGKSETLSIEVPLYYLASYDETGLTGYESAYVLEEGQYNFYAGNNVRTAQLCASISLEKTELIEQLTQAMAPNKAFKRIKPNGTAGSYKVDMEDVPLVKKDMDEKRRENLPAEIPVTGDKGIKLTDVKNGKATMDAFIAQFSDDDLCCISRGEGMGSLKVTLGTAAAFGGVTKHLQEMGIPCGCCDDGPSGLRLDSGVKAFNMPNGTLMACSFNTQILTELYSFAAMEMKYNKIECLLGPGMNIHRHPLNGRNFEYFSEDPLVTGIMASAQLKGLATTNVTGTVKHFCANNQETRRHDVNGVISERALREIYLKGFEIAIKEGKATSVMTTYGPVNGRWTAGTYDLVTTILRNEWGFDGFAMTDWYACINDFGKPKSNKNRAAMARAQNDVYMVVPNCTSEECQDNLPESLANGTLTRAELQRNAANICRFLMNSNALAVLNKCDEKVEIINRPKDASDVEIPENLEALHSDDEITIPLDTKPSVKGENYVFALETNKPGNLKVSLTGSSSLSETAQIPCTLFYQGIPIASFMFNGTGGKEVTMTAEAHMYSPYAVFRLNVGQDGANLKALKIEFLGNIDGNTFFS